ncbi:glycosyltransferase [Marinobacter salinisoli]|uniref:Glycosyltransferase n=1 Tax=Marinobacter salinisoli TaxID=2769486 RepID=A0ABX7MUT2_9GAMM|nr:glycosyltransferase [Marinobacter salinisoli]QSP96058.1 glycosyltransferase [Marinobacter salinisoli]
MTDSTATARSRPIIFLLLMAGLGGALFSSSMLAASTLLLAIVGGLYVARGVPEQLQWDTPKELRLLHFAFWFFVAVSTLSWTFEGFDYEGGKTLGTHARLILFWPLIIAFSCAGLRAWHFFSAMALAALSVSGVFLAELVAHDWAINSLLSRRFGGGINPISFGNLALLASTLSLVSALYFIRSRKVRIAFICGGLGISAFVIALLSETRSNLIALPVLLLVFLPLVDRKLRRATILLIPLIIAVALYNADRMSKSLEALIEQQQLDMGMEVRLTIWKTAGELFSTNPGFGAGLGGYTRQIEELVANGSASTTLLDCCAGHAHNDLLTQAATSGVPGILGWAFLIFIPLTLFARHLFNSYAPVAHLSAAGVMVSSAYLLFGLTEATFNRTLFLTFYLLSIAGIAAALFNELSASYSRQRNCKVSATIITKNEEAHIADCIKSARLVADEIIVLDSGSTDQTADIAREHADIVEITDWPGFGIQKQRALEKATGDWVLSLDADERITPELAREINHHLADPDADAYKLPWAVTIYGKRLDFGRSGRAPLRLFRREGVRFSDALVHERILIPEGRRTKTLRGRLTHYTHRDFGHSLEKSAKYAWLGALEKHRRGKKTRTMIYPTLRGLLTFIQVYFIRFGFLDGAVGYLTAVTYAQVTFNKYAGLWTLNRADRGKG